VRVRLALGAVLLLFAARSLAAQDSYARLRDAAKYPSDWTTYSGSYHSQRFSLLRQITNDNVSRLRPAWVYQSRGNDVPRIEATPLVVDGVMYLTEGITGVVALDARTGRALWRWERGAPRDLQVMGYRAQNRGVAVLDGMVFVGTVDARLFALDARSGVERWRVKVADYHDGYGITGAPLALDGKVIVGTSGGEAGVRGFLDAYDARTGRRLWRFWTVPAPGEPGSETWQGDAWRTGGGTTWVTGSYDPELNLLYWGTGNPSPQVNGELRPGDNLYTCSVVALDAGTGRLRWHFQFTPHDTHDWDSAQVPMLIDATFQGRKRNLLAIANRNGFYYLLDRVTGEFLLGRPYVKQTWARGLDARGRPIILPEGEPTWEGTLVYPGVPGGATWPGPAYSPETDLVYVPAREAGSWFFKGHVDLDPSTMYFAGIERPRINDSTATMVRALDRASGTLRWEFPTFGPFSTGLLATAGQLVFSGTFSGEFFALDARTGALRWHFNTGGMIAGPMSYAVDGKQYVAVAAGTSVFAFAVP
jgi:alcohol dehydrogenase (cytochrome c)